MHAECVLDKNMKTFNTTGTCDPKVHYMVNIDRQVDAAATLVRQGHYFCINRGRQYGKTTTLAALARKLKSEYCVFKISFEGLGDSAFVSIETVCAEFLKILKRCSRVNGSSPQVVSILKEFVPIGMREVLTSDFADIVEELCNASDRPLVVLIDEVDQAGNNDAFIKFLGVLRNMFLSRDEFPTFQSVILAGVYDVKNLKLKIRSDEDHQYNSPWNIAVTFDTDMSLPADGIAGMLDDYANEHDIQFDTTAIGQLIYDYTSGYPFLVSRLCQIIDQNQFGWDKEGVLQAVNALLKERNTLFDDMFKKLDQFPELWELFKDILFSGKRIPYSIDDVSIQIASMFSFVKEEQGALVIFCRLMETRIYNAMMLKLRNDFTDYGERNKPKFIVDGRLNMRLVLEKFVMYFNEIYADSDTKFLEKEARKQFLLYLRPIINGVGNYYVEAETRDQTRADVVVDYLGQQYVIELKIWHGERYNEEGEQQLRQYLEYFQVAEGYLVSFCFNKNKQPGIHEVKVGDRTIIEAVV